MTPDVLDQVERAFGKSAMKNVVNSYRRDGLSVRDAIRAAAQWRDRMDDRAEALSALRAARKEG